MPETEHKIRIGEPHLPPGISIKTTVSGHHNPIMAVQSAMQAANEIWKMIEMKRKGDPNGIR